MKKHLLAGAVLIGLAFATPTQAQIKFSVNIGVQPSWGPTGYDHVEYYYIPDIQAYYYVPNHQFVYQRGGRWVFSQDLPARYHDFDLYHSHKVVINEPKPYLHYQEHQRMYDHFRGEHDRQEFIRGSHDNRYQKHWHDKRDANEDRRHHDNGHH
ncbi:hypothetical protein [Puia sp.]|uniref:hypothetical protein n=1 Tax=Puia sp. TaxID=2045100 RepID=UPI002F4048F1